MYTTLKERISSEIYKVWDMTSGVDEVTAKIIEEIIKPIAKEAFEAGEVYGKAELTDSVNVRFSTPTFDEWINENLK